MSEGSKGTAAKAKGRTELRRVAIRFSGDSGDGMQMTGSQFSDVSALAGNELLTLPDFPSEIRAPAGTVAGLSGYQVHFGSDVVLTTGDQLDVLVAMNPAALKAGLKDLKPKGIAIVNSDAFAPGDLKKAGYEINPLTDGTLTNYAASLVPMTRLTSEAVATMGLTSHEAARCRNMFALGLICWLFDRPANFMLKAIAKRFAKSPKAAEANVHVFQAGYQYG
ncbi:MAG: 2-oxoacid:acceptor oxidoreductase family protein, partial [Phycisphaerae bacterium]|nr:2-oxoacid:acceptor oxidoreductase family protein [Phycisphaerae bacterium]